VFECKTSEILVKTGFFRLQTVFSKEKRPLNVPFTKKSAKAFYTPNQPSWFVTLIMLSPKLCSF